MHSKPAEKGTLGKPQAIHNHYTQSEVNFTAEIQAVGPNVSAGKQDSIFYPFSSLLSWHQQCCRIPKVSKSVFINPLQSFIYFHRPFVIALSKPFDRFLSHSCPYIAISTGNERKSVEPLNASSSTKFLCHYGYNSSSTHSVWKGKGNKDFQVVFMNCMLK